MVYSDFTKQDYAPQDFLRLIEHRIRKEIRQHNLVDPKKSYVLEETTSLPAQVLTHFLKRIFDGRLDLSGSLKLSTGYLELYVQKNLDVFLGTESSQQLFEQSLAPLRCITGKELQEVASLLDMQTPFEPVMHEIVDSLQEKYPQTKPSFLKSFVHVQSLNKDN